MVAQKACGRHGVASRSFARTPVLPGRNRAYGPAAASPDRHSRGLGTAPFRLREGLTRALGTGSASCLGQRIRFILAVALRRKILGSRGGEFSLRRLKVGHKRRIGMKAGLCGGRQETALDDVALPMDVTNGRHRTLRHLATLTSVWTPRRFNSSQRPNRNIGCEPRFEGRAS